MSKTISLMQSLKELSIIMFVMLMATLLVLGACARKPQQVTNVTQVAPQPALITRPALPEECAAGGLVVQLGREATIVCNGLPGVNARPVEVMKLCPLSTDTYPSVFVEYALCIDNQLYAVYSVPNAFLTLLTPGTYNSNGINSTCSFTVGAGCSISH